MSEPPTRTDDRRLIEDYLPIEAISAEASREKSVRKGHISTLHLWWARRPLVACRAAVYGALIPASQFIPSAAQTDEKKKSLGRANAAKFVKALCQYPGSPHFIKEAQHHILKAHAERLTREIADWKSGSSAQPAWVDELKFTGKEVTVDDITAERAPRPRVLDMFAGGGAIPLEALRLGCEAYALDLNPVAHIIELCTLVYPQKYGRPDPNARGMTGPKNAKGEATWGGLADEVRYWGEWIVRKVKAEIGDLYPLIPDPEFKGKRSQIQTDWLKEHDEVPAGYLMPVAYLWTRTVQCKNPACRARVPLVKQTWLSKKPARFVALRMGTPKGSKKVRFELVESRSESGLGFDPAEFSKTGNATCAFCGTVAASDYVKAEGCAGRIDEQLMATVCIRAGRQGKWFITSNGDLSSETKKLSTRIDKLCKETGLTVPNEPIVTDAKNSCWTHLYGLTTFGSLFTARQQLYLLTLAKWVQLSAKEMDGCEVNDEHRMALLTYLGCLLDRQADYDSSLCVWESGGQFIKSTFTQKGLPMAWDFVELAPFGGASGSPAGALAWITAVLENEASQGLPATAVRGSAMQQPWRDDMFDVVVTDPPYYDNVPYSNIADFFYVWLKRSIGSLYPQDFASAGTPKKSEAVADATRHGGSKAKANAAYEEMMATSLREAARTLKPQGMIAMVYAHKTTLGWATLVDAFRRSGFTVTEAWPLDTERPGRVRSINSAALASSIFLTARKRDEAAAAGKYEDEVLPDLNQIVRERVDTLWQMDVSGADLVIACVGAGLRAFTRFASVEYANGEQVPAERFLTEVETVVLDTILQKLSKAAGGNGSRSRSLAGLDPATRFYVLWRYTYGPAELDAGEAIIFANGTHVELDGPLGLSTRSHALIEKKKTNTSCEILPTAATMMISVCPMSTAANPGRRSISFTGCCGCWRKNRHSYPNSSPMRSRISISCGS
jgi:putative DNA methylase